MLPLGCRSILNTHLLLITRLLVGLGQRDHVPFSVNASNSRPIGCLHSGFVTAWVQQGDSDSKVIPFKYKKGMLSSIRCFELRIFLFFWGLEFPVFERVMISLVGTKGYELCSKVTGGLVWSICEEVFLVELYIICRESCFRNYREDCPANLLWST